MLPHDADDKIEYLIDSGKTFRFEVEWKGGTEDLRVATAYVGILLEFEEASHMDIQIEKGVHRIFLDQIRNWTVREKE